MASSGQMPNPAPRPTFSTYADWLRIALGVDLSRAARGLYESQSSKARGDILKSAFWTQFLGGRRAASDRYQERTGYSLWAADRAPEIVAKSFESMVSKSFRKNVIENSGWPAPPSGGWILPATWFGQIKDIVRTEVFVRYLDGIEWVAREIEALCAAVALECSVDFEARLEGYYAVHFNVHQEVEIQRAALGTQRQTISVEIQLATQIQDVIRALTHRRYEDRRMESPSSRKWQWDYHSEAFKVNYLGHILHYMEGMIMDVRTMESTSTT
jgi:hypothetical protein